MRRLLHLALLASLGLLALLPAFDHHAAEYSPWHGHVIVGGAPLPAVHVHPFAQPHDHPTHAHGPAPAFAQGVVFTPSPLAGIVSFLAAFDQLLPLAWLALLPLAALWILSGTPRLFARLSLPPRLDPPPRLLLD